VVTVNPYMTPDLSEPRRVARFDQRRLTFHDLTPLEQDYVSAERRLNRRIGADVAIGAVVIVLAWIVGLAFVGDPALDEPPTPTAYTHPAPEGATP
jgi:hypothetical protein